MKKGNKTKGMFGTSLRRSEFDDELLRDNMRTNNRLKTEMQYHDRAHRVIMKDIGKETHLLQSKLENDRRDSSFGINGYKFGTTSLQLPRRYSYDLSIGSPLSADSAKNATHNFNKGGKRHSADVKMMADKDSDSSQRPTMHISKSSDRLSNLSTRYPSAKVESDDFLSTVLNEAMKDELLYTRSPQRMSANVVRRDEPKTPRRRKAKSMTEKSSSSSYSIVDALNIGEADSGFQMTPVDNQR